MLRVPIEWLKEYVAIRLAPEALADKLTMAGFEVTGIESVDGEPVFSLEVTPNRADCLSIIGIAREVAAITGQRLKFPWVQGSGFRVQGITRRPRTPHPEPRTRLRIRIEDREGCRVYIGRLIEGVHMAPSPEWMQRRLLACGLRPISNVVDITNYVLLEYGQPLHAFDYARLRDGAIVVRRAKPGETLIAIDGQLCALSTQMLIIADAQRPVAIAGVMGARETAVNEATTHVLLESAWFDPILIRRTGRALGLASESSYRFERGVDLAGVEPASQRASALITQLAGGREVAVRSVGRTIQKPVVIGLRPDRVNQRLGTSLTMREIARSLQALGATVQTTSSPWRVRVPSFRRDLKHEVDLIEEVVRVIGYERLPEHVPQAAIAQARVQEGRYERLQALRQLCASVGLWEIMTWALVSPEECARLRAPEWTDQSVRVANPLSRDHSVLRPGLLLGMLRAISKNLGQGARGARLFELGHVFEPDHQTGGAREALRLGIGLAGAWEQHWQGKQDAGLFRLKGVVEQIGQRGGAVSMSVERCAVDWGEPGRSMRVSLDRRPIGYLGQVETHLLSSFDIERPVWFGELVVEPLIAEPRATKTVITPSLFPPVKRDLSILVDKQVEFVRLRQVINAIGGALTSRVELIDRYADQSPIPPDKQSLTCSIEYRDRARTLTAEEVDALHSRIGGELVRQCGAQLR